MQKNTIQLRQATLFLMRWSAACVSKVTCYTDTGLPCPTDVSMTQEYRLPVFLTRVSAALGSQGCLLHRVKYI